jgi:hypothetical protein
MVRKSKNRRQIDDGFKLFACTFNFKLIILGKLYFEKNEKKMPFIWRQAGKIHPQVVGYLLTSD